MSNLWAVIPVKSFQDSKSRLSGVLSAEKRTELTRALFLHTLSVLKQIPEVAGYLVVSRDQAVCDMAEAEGAVSLLEPQPHNLNSAVASGTRAAQEQGAHSVLILPIDLPLLRTEDVEMVVALPDRVVICPDYKYDGTNALLIRDIKTFEFKYGDESFTKHLAETARHGAVAQVVYADSIEFDLDTPADWIRYQKSESVIEL